VSGGALALVVVVGLIGPGSVFAYPHSIISGEPITELYAFEGGNLFLLATLVLLSGCLLAALAAAGRMEDRHGAKPALAVAAVLAGLFIAVYPSGSQDLFHNIADARTLLVYGQNPMTVAPSAHPADPLVATVVAWRDDPSFYGPLSYALYAVPAFIAGDGVLANMVAFKAFNALALIALALLVGQVAKTLGANTSQAIVMVGWNPLLLYETVGNGHNDVFMVLLAVAAILLSAHGAGPVALIPMAFSAAVKYPAMVLVPVAWWWLWIRAQRVERKWLIVLALAGALVGAATLFFLADALQAGRDAAVGRPPVWAPISVLAHIFEPVLGDRAIFGARLVCWGAFLACALVALRGMGTSARSLVVASFWVIAALTLLTVRQVYPSYLIWFVCLGAVLVGSLAWKVALVASISGLLTYAVFTDWQRWGAAEDLTYFAVFIAMPGMIAVLWHRWRSESIAPQDPSALTLQRG
jgi:hypothetical protein